MFNWYKFYSNFGLKYVIGIKVLVINLFYFDNCVVSLKLLQGDLIIWNMKLKGNGVLLKCSSDLFLIEFFFHCRHYAVEI